MKRQRRFLCCLAAILGLAVLTIYLSAGPVDVVDLPPPQPAAKVVLPTRPRPPPTFTPGDRLELADTERLRIDPWGLALRLAYESHLHRFAIGKPAPPSPTEGHQAALGAIAADNAMLLSVGNSPVKKFRDPESGLPVRFLGSVVTAEDVAFAAHFNAEIYRAILDGRVQPDLHRLELVSPAWAGRYSDTSDSDIEDELRLGVSLLARPADGTLVAAGRRLILDLGAGHGLKPRTPLTVWIDRPCGLPEVVGAVRVTNVSFWRSEADLVGLFPGVPVPGAGMRISSPFFRPGHPTIVWVDPKVPDVRAQLARSGIRLAVDLDDSVDVAVIYPGDRRTRTLAQRLGARVVAAPWVRALLLFW